MIVKTVPELVAEIGKRFLVGIPTNTYRSVTGEPYVVIGSQAGGAPEIPGTVGEGWPHEWAFDEETACMQAGACFESYAEDRKGTLYWRSAPRLEWDGKKDRCCVYMRGLISDKPEGTK